MARARQGQHRWHRPEWGAPERLPPRRRWSLPILLLVVVAGAAWFWKHPEQLPEFVKREYAELREAVSATPPPPPKTGGRLVYRWRDGAGVVQFTDKPPPEGVQYVPLHLDPATNALPADTSPWPER